MCKPKDGRPLSECCLSPSHNVLQYQLHARRHNVFGFAGSYSSESFIPYMIFPKRPLHAVRTKIFTLKHTSSLKRTAAHHKTIRFRHRSHKKSQASLRLPHRPHLAPYTGPNRVSSPKYTSTSSTSSTTAHAADFHLTTTCTSCQYSSHSTPYQPSANSEMCAHDPTTSTSPPLSLRP